MIKGILFDKDGTLLEFFNLWHEIIKNVLSDLETDYSIKKETIKNLKQLSGFQQYNFEKESMIQYLATTQIVDLWMDILRKESERITFDALMELFNKKAAADNLDITAKKGVKELLGYLKAEGYELGVATADMEYSTCNGLKKAGIFNYFSYIGFNEDDVNPKPSPDMAVSFCQKVNIKTEEILIVGDSVTDMEFADNAGAQFVGIKTDYNKYNEFIMQNKPVVENIYDIIQVMKL